MNERTGSILIVDDDPDCRGIVSTRLNGLGYDVREAPDGFAALDAIRKGGVDVVVLDIMMPDLDGYEVLDQVNQLSDPPNVILLSAIGHLESRLRGLYGGAVDYMAKPFDTQELVARIYAAARQRGKFRRVKEDSMTDALTGLRNRRFFDHELRVEILRAQRAARILALAYLDADGMKLLNDSYGHEVGDLYLKAIASALLATCRASDTACRIGGDEFAAILPDSDRRGAREFLERFNGHCRAECGQGELKGKGLSISAGIAVLGEDGDSNEELCRKADEALYRAKGRQSVAVS